MRPSDDVLEALAVALDLDDEERRHLFLLARAARRPMPAQPDREPERVPDSTRRLLRVMNTPAVVLGRHLDLLDWNPMAEALLGEADMVAPDRRNMLLLMFDDTMTGERGCPDRERQALDYIGMMRAAVATDPAHPRATAIVGELTIRSAEFRRLWPVTTSASRSAAARPSESPRSATSSWTGTRIRCPVTQARSCWSSPPNQAAPTRTDCSSWGRRSRPGRR